MVKTSEILLWFLVQNQHVRKYDS